MSLGRKNLRSLLLVFHPKSISGRKGILVMYLKSRAGDNREADCCSPWEVAERQTKLVFIELGSELK